MAERRWNPVLGEWILVAAQRQERTFMPPEDFCPLCPTKPGAFPTDVPREDYEIAIIENRFPAMTLPADEPAGPPHRLHRSAPAEGLCEVVLYTPRHEGTLTDASADEIEKLVWVWADRAQELGSRPQIKYVFIFENKGKAIGVTLTHPHGQIYAFPFIPPVPARKLANALAHYEKEGSCLFCDILAAERENAERVVAENDHFTAFIPYFARYAYEVHIYPRRHLVSLVEMDAAERRSLAEVLKAVLVAYDELWGISMPYIMAMYPAPSDGGGVAEYPHFHFHIEFYPPHRTKDKLKYLAGCESAMGTFVSDTLPEERAAELREHVPTAIP